MGESNGEEMGKMEKEGNSIIDELDASELKKMMIMRNKKEILLCILAEKEDNGDGTLEEVKTEMGLISPNKNQGVSLFEEMNTIKLTGIRRLINQ